MSGSFWSRRSFLKASLGGALALIGGRAFGKGLMPQSLSEGKLALYNVHTQERLNVTYRDRWGQYHPQALEALNYTLRCHYTQKVREIDIQVLEFLNVLDNQFGGNNEIHIISGYRSPGYNNLLRKQGHQVSRHSLHLFGKAIDLCIPRVGLDVLKEAAVGLGYGGVGYYPLSGFIHIDSGRFRTW